MVTHIVTTSIIILDWFGLVHGIVPNTGHGRNKGNNEQYHGTKSTRGGFFRIFNTANVKRLCGQNDPAIQLYKPFSVARVSGMEVENKNR
jgi:hypothetical protein